ncbi:hypothetical protein [Roseivivax sediminis]|uniref:Uncharacterized protein n=1 Tax=Roseivivax sediminis TaxID=936889 RepID=A0A1I1ZDJ9_9RHOB|nr:hypothetical protein [Roseivivax sediminis]SFE28583.1 hypothetical protein SAMN04515678_10863 [Roseivivax sediminis]
MSLLSATQAGAGTWLLAGAVSLALHAGALAALVLPRTGDGTQAPGRPIVQSIVTLERLDSNVIARSSSGVAAEGDAPDPAPPQDRDPAPPAAPDTAAVLPAPPARLSPNNTPAAATTRPLPPLSGPGPIARRSGATAPDPASRALPQRAEDAPPSTRDDGTDRAAEMQASPTPQRDAPDRLALVPTPAPRAPPDRPEPPAEGRRSIAAGGAPSPQDLALGDLLKRIRATPADPCLVALPRRDGAERTALALIAAGQRAMADFSARLLTPADADMKQNRTLVDRRQCAALEYLRSALDYPALRLGLALDRAIVPSGGRLTGRIRGLGDRALTLLLVDTNGVVHDLARFTARRGDIAEFDVPLTRTGPRRDTEHLLLALATEAPPEALLDRAGQRAEEVFAGSGSRGARLASATFSVR